VIGGGYGLGKVFNDEALCVDEISFYDVNKELSSMSATQNKGHMKLPYLVGVGWRRHSRLFRLVPIEQDHIELSIRLRRHLRWHRCVVRQNCGGGCWATSVSDWSTQGTKNAPDQKLQSSTHRCFFLLETVAPS
jgi:hypothetical protein